MARPLPAGESARIDPKPGLDVNAALAALFSLLFLSGGLGAIALAEFDVLPVFLWCAGGTALLAWALMLLGKSGRLGSARSGFGVLIGSFIVGPFLLAQPLVILVPGLDQIDATFEMVSALTTTGASALRTLEGVPDSVILWRSVVASFGGLLWLVAGVAILAPRGIGGFEVTQSVKASRDDTARLADLPRADRGLSFRLLTAARRLFPIFAGFVATATLVFAASGIPAFDALCLALSVSATAGFTPQDGGVAMYDSRMLEAFLVPAMILPSIGVLVHLRVFNGEPKALLNDPELRYLVIAVLIFVALIFTRHWLGAIETRSVDEVAMGLKVLWGAMFMAVSFITTTGFESASWGEASGWSGLATPGVILLALALVGGAASSTAGGVKLIRAALLAKHSYNELASLVRPRAVRSVRSGGRTISLDIMRASFVFAMLFILTVAATMLALTAFDVAFVDALIASVALVSNTGPAHAIATGETFFFADLEGGPKVIASIAMIIGRLETLAVVSMLSPATWRR